MTRLLPRISRRRAEREPVARPAGDTAAAADPPAGDTAAPAGTSEAAPRPPAGTEPTPPRPGFRERGRLRRRLRFLRRVRELGFRDLGGLVFDQHRFARPDEALVQAKLAALAAVDGELRAIERVLRDERPFAELREAGVSACPRCGGLVGSDARFCSSCGAPVSGAREVAAVVAEPPGETPPEERPAADPDAAERGAAERHAADAAGQPPPEPVTSSPPDAPTRVARPGGGGT